MACMGPSEATDKQAAEVSQKVIDFLAEKKHIYRGKRMPHPFPNQDESRKKNFENLQSAIKAILTQDNMEGF